MYKVPFDFVKRQGTGSDGTTFDYYQMRFVFDDNHDFSVTIKRAIFEQFSLALENAALRQQINGK